MQSKRVYWLTVFALAALGTAVWAEEIPFSKNEPAKQVPAVFQGKAAERLAAEEVARQDAYRKLIERVYGLSLDAQTDVQDFALKSRVIDTALHNELKGMKEVDWKYHDDGLVEAAIKVTLRDVVQVIKSNYERVEQDARLVSEKTVENVALENRDTDILVVGRGALDPAKVRAMRAAEEDAYAKLSARVFGLRVSSETTVRDFTLANDRIRSKVCVCLLNGVKLTEPKFLDDGTCTIKGTLTIREVVQVLTRTYRRYGQDSKIKVEDIEKIDTENRDAVLSETGQAIIGKAESTVSAQYVEKKTVVERVLSKGIAVTP